MKIVTTRISTATIIPRMKMLIPICKSWKIGMGDGVVTKLKMVGMMMRKGEIGIIDNHRKGGLMISKEVCLHQVEICCAIYHVSL